MFRLRHNPCQGFPVRVSRGVCPALLLPLPSSNRTCGFPASGSHSDSRSRGLSRSCAPAQKLYALPFEIGVVAFALRFLKAPLAAPVQMVRESRLDYSPGRLQHITPLEVSIERVEFELRFLFRLQTQLLPQIGDFLRQRHGTRRFFRSRNNQSALLSSDQKRVKAQAPSLGGRYPRRHYYEPVRLPTHARHAVMHSRARLSLGLLAWSGLPSSPPVCRRALPPLTPEGSTNASVRCFFVDVRLQPFWQSGRLHSHNEAETGSLTLRLAPSLPGASAAGLLPRSPPSRLLVERTIAR